MIDVEGARQHMMMLSQCNAELADERDALLAALKWVMVAMDELYPPGAPYKAAHIDAMEAARLAIAKAEGTK